jgi:putative two-component system response regulator
MDQPRRTRVLVVDDDEMVCEVLSRVLERSGYLVQTACSAEHALDMMGRSELDLVICDMQMGGMSGLDLTSIAKHLFPDVPIVIMTARRDTELMRTALRQGAADFLPKPFDSEAIPIIVERSLERRALNLLRSEEQRRTHIFASIQVLAAAIDAKEPYTAQHSRRVARLAVATAAAMSLPESDCQFVDWAAQVHDVGKIATPDHILSKPGRLTDEEWSIVRQHPARGAHIIGQVEELSYVASLVRSHHERIDGGGYPDGLCGEHIPLLSRVIAVTDAFEVMTSHRVYQAPVSEDEALSRLADGANSQFDAAVVDAFAALPRTALL